MSDETTAGQDSLDVPRGSGPPAKGPYDPDRIRERVADEAMRNTAREDSLDVVEARPLTGRDVHAAWRDGMLTQGREVAAQRMSWDTLDQLDRDLDDSIAATLDAARRPAPALLPDDDEPYHGRPESDLTIGEVNVRAGWNLARSQVRAALWDSPTSVETVDRLDHPFEFDEFAQPWQCGRCGVFKSGHPDPSDRPSPPDRILAALDRAWVKASDARGVPFPPNVRDRFIEELAAPSPVPEDER